MHDTAIVDGFGRKYGAVRPVLDERARRHWAAAEASELGWGGISAVAAATGLARDTIRAGTRELRQRPVVPAGAGRIRRPGGGRKPLAQLDPGLRRRLAPGGQPPPPGGPRAPAPGAGQRPRPPGPGGTGAR